MERIYILQYRADRQDKHKLDDAIAWWTKFFNKDTPPHSHSEIYLGKGVVFSSTTRNRGGDKKSIGTRFEDFEIVTRNKHRWDVYVNDFNSADVTLMWIRAKQIAGRPYNFAGLFLDFFLPFGWLGSMLKKKWYCSQAVYHVLTGRRTRISPRRLTPWLLKNGFEYLGNLAWLDLKPE